MVIVLAGSLVGVLGFGVAGKRKGALALMFLVMAPRQKLTHTPSIPVTPPHAHTGPPHTEAYNTGEALSSYELFVGSCHASLDDD